MTVFLALLLGLIVGFFAGAVVVVLRIIHVLHNEGYFDD